MTDQPTVDEIGTAALNEMFGGGEIQDLSDAGASNTGDTPAAPVDTQPRGADGKFIPKEEEIAPEPEGYTEEVAVEFPEEEAEEGEDQPVAEVDDDSEIVLELDEGVLDLVNTKYGGDIGKALEALQEAQSVIGRQGTELGELREIRNQVDSLRELMTLQQQASSVDWDEVIADNPETAVHMALQYQNPQAFEEALESWAAVEPIKAFTFLQEIQQAATAPPPTNLESEMDGLMARYPDLQQRLPAIEKAAGERPALARLLNDEDPRTRAQALEDLYHLSAGAGTPDTSKAAKRIVLQARAEADAAKADAAVVSASNTAPPPAPAKSGDTALAETLQEYLGLGDDFKIVG